MIRKLKKTDYESVKDLVMEIYELHLANRPDIYKEGNPVPYEYFLDYMNNPDNVSFVYLKNEQIVGLIMTKITTTTGIGVMKNRRICFIDDLVVKNSYRQMGIATAMFNHLKKELQFKNVDAIELNVWAFNKDAIKFYESLKMAPKNIRYECNI